MSKYVFITGGVVSSLGKGITAASLGCLLKSRGLSVTLQKLDPYINFDPGTMNPYQHGEVFVTEDGTETDLDLGHYERFTGENLTGGSNVTTGKIYWSALNREREGFYRGQTVQVIPHITDTIKERVTEVSRQGNHDVVITEIGGTVGDIESLPFLEAIRQLKTDMGSENVLYIHVTLLPYLSTTKELKTKPTQHSVKELRSIGIQPDLIVCRTEHRISRELKDKIALFCDILPQEIVENYSVDIIYEVPLMLQKQNMDTMVLQKLGLPDRGAKMESWYNLIDKWRNLNKEIKVGMIGKYVSLKDAYLSIKEALLHAGIFNNTEVKIEFIDAEEIENNSDLASLSNLHGILVPGGFGDRGIEGKINAIRFARENRVPFLGLCLGMQCAVIEFARNVAGCKDAHSTEFYPDTPFPVIDLLPGQDEQTPRGGTLRLGAYPCTLRENSLSSRVYQNNTVWERHRHRYEFNNRYRELLGENGMLFSGIYPTRDLVEIVELKNHPWFVAVQFHPEFKSRPNQPHPLFRDFVASALKCSHQGESF